MNQSIVARVARQPYCVIQHPGADTQLLYFTSTSLMDGDRGIVFLSNVTGEPNLFYRDLVTGQEVQLSDNRDGVLKSYVYFEGLERTGLGKASVSLDCKRGVAYYLQGYDVVAVDMKGRRRVLATLPKDQVTAFSHVSHDGTRLCVPTTDAVALRQELATHPDRFVEIDRAVQREKLGSWLRVYDTDSGELLACEAVPCAWVTHVQFSPVNRDLILYNHEWPGDCGIRRMWLWDGIRHIRLRPENVRAGQCRDDMVCHEMWSRDGDHILYHGQFASDGRSFLGRVCHDGSGRCEIPFERGWDQYGHFTVSNQSSVTVSDGYFLTPADRGACVGQWISVQKNDWEKGEVNWYPLCRHGSSWKSQDAHPHPIFNHAGDVVFFNSDKSGKCAIYGLDVRDVFWD